MFVRPSLRERQRDWFEGMEASFLRFGGVPVLFDNARALVEHHDAATREVRFNDRLHRFARHWGFRPRASAPYRAGTKGKDERGVGYVKRNAIAGRRFPSWNAFVAHLDRWTREIADQRVHGTTGEAPIALRGGGMSAGSRWPARSRGSPSRASSRASSSTRGPRSIRARSGNSRPAAGSRMATRP